MKNLKISNTIYKAFAAAAVTAALVVGLPAYETMAQENGACRVLLPGDAGYKYDHKGTENGKMYALYETKGLRNPSDKLTWDILKSGLDFIDQKTAEGTELSFTIPDKGTGIETLYVCGEDENVKLAAYLLPAGSGWNGWYSDEALNAPLGTSYKAEAGKTWEDITAILPSTAYLKLKAGSDTKAFKVSLSYTKPEDFTEIKEKAVLDLKASVTMADAVYSPFFAEMAAPALAMRVTGPGGTEEEKEDPEGAAYAINVMSGATASKNGIKATSAKKGEVIDISWERKADYSFVKWNLNGASCASLTSPVTTFTMGSSEVSVQYEDKLNFSEEVYENKDELPKEADTETKVKSLKFGKKKLILTKNGNPAENPATAAVKTGDAPQVYYTTSNAGIVAVNKDGVFYPTGQGVAKVTAYCGNKTAVCDVTVKSYTENIVILDEKGSDVTDQTQIMKPGEQAFYTVSFDPYDSTDPKKVTWSTDNLKISVKNGIVTAKEVKKDTAATIKAAVNYTDPSSGRSRKLTKSFRVEVSPVKIEAAKSADKTHTLALAKKNLSLKTGGSGVGSDLGITIIPKSKELSIENGDFSISCNSSNESIVTVGEPEKLSVSGKKGVSAVKLTAKEAGTAYVIVTTTSRISGEKVNVQRCKVTVTSPATAIAAKSSSLDIKESGGKKTLTMRKGSYGVIEAVLTPEYSTDLSKVKISAKGGVTVSNGILYAKKETAAGKSATLTVTCGKLKDTVEITVTK